MLTLIQVGDVIIVLNNVKKVTQFDTGKTNAVSVDMMDKDQMVFYGSEATHLWERLVNTCTITIR